MIYGWHELQQITVNEMSHWHDLQLFGCGQKRGGIGEPDGPLSDNGHRHNLAVFAHSQARLLAERVKFAGNLEGNIFINDSSGVSKTSAGDPPWLRADTGAAVLSPLPDKGVAAAGQTSKQTASDTPELRAGC